jgi:hypothetical protein
VVEFRFGICAATTCRNCRGALTPKPLLTGLPATCPGDCSQNCSCSILTAQQAAIAHFCNLLKTKIKAHRVLTGDPLSPRQFPVQAGSGLLSSTYVSMACGHDVESCGTLLNAGAPSSYKIIYSFGFWARMTAMRAVKFSPSGMRRNS